MKDHVKRTFSENVLTGLGSFGSMYRLDLGDISEPVLVSGTDGVGTEAEDRISDGQARYRRTATAWPCASTTSSARAPSRCSFLDYLAAGKLGPGAGGR